MNGDNGSQPGEDDELLQMLQQAAAGAKKKRPLLEEFQRQTAPNEAQSMADLGITPEIDEALGKRIEQILSPEQEPTVAAPGESMQQEQPPMPSPPPYQRQPGEAKMRGMAWEQQPPPPVAPPPAPSLKEMTDQEQTRLSTLQQLRQVATSNPENIQQALASLSPQDRALIEQSPWVPGVMGAGPPNPREFVNEAKLDQTIAQSQSKLFALQQHRRGLLPPSAQRAIPGLPPVEEEEAAERAAESAPQRLAVPPKQSLPATAPANPAEALARSISFTQAANVYDSDPRFAQAFGADSRAFGIQFLRHAMQQGMTLDGAKDYAELQLQTQKLDKDLAASMMLPYQQATAEIRKDLDAMPRGWTAGDYAAYVMMSLIHGPKWGLQFMLSQYQQHEKERAGLEREARGYTVMGAKAQQQAMTQNRMADFRQATLALRQQGFQANLAHFDQTQGLKERAEAEREIADEVREADQRAMQAAQVYNGTLDPDEKKKNYELWLRLSQDAAGKRKAAQAHGARLHPSPIAPPPPPGGP